jgi:imidazole glycerol-phosphate synthase subunit HisH
MTASSSSSANPSAVASPRIAVLDYGIGNLPSVCKSIERSGGDAFITNDARAIAGADAVVLPGVGAMGRCMESLDAHHLRRPVLDAIASGRPFLGICVGMQMLHAGSEEFGGVEGLGIFPAVVRLLPDTVKRPQMQWNIVRTRGSSVLLHGLGDTPWMYFVHSFAPELHNDVVGVCDYGIEVSCVVERANVMGTQFHPEKSSKSGLALLANFVGAAGGANVATHGAVATGSTSQSAGQ